MFNGVVLTHADEFILGERNKEDEQAGFCTCNRLGFVDTPFQSQP
jgi:hypothetical protein